MNGGMASGTAANTPQTPRPGSKVRSTAHAQTVPTSPATTVLASTMAMVLSNSSPTSGRTSRAFASLKPTCAACSTV